MSLPDMNPNKSVAGIAVDPYTRERVIPESRRADGSVRQQRKVRPGYTPQEDVSLFRGSRQTAAAGQNRHAPGYLPPGAPPPKTTEVVAGGDKSLSKSAAKNAKRRAKKQAEKEQMIKDNWDSDSDGDSQPGKKDKEKDKEKEEPKHDKEEEEGEKNTEEIQKDRTTTSDKSKDASSDLTREVEKLDLGS